MSAFIGRLCLQFINDPVTGRLLKNRGGSQLYKMLQTPPDAFGFQSDLAGQTIIPPDGFVTDLASIPRLPIVYLALNDIANEDGVIHDYLYSTGIVSRLMADQILREACLVSGLPAWKATLIYWGVRVGGAGRYGPQYTA